MYQITLDEAAGRLPELVRELKQGDEVILMENEMPLARLLPPEPELPRPQARRGSHKGEILYMAPDFDATPEGFEEYMP